MDDLFQQLSAPFPPEDVSWRVGSTNINKQTGKPPEGQPARGIALAYIDARDVQDRFDDVCGPAGWERRHPHVGGTTTCEIAVWIEGRGWVVKADGAGDTDVEAEKGSLSDAFKRAAVNWGVGRYLYRLPSPWVQLEPKGRSWIISDSEKAKLEEILSKHTTVFEWGTPESRATLKALGQTIRTCLHTSDDVRRFREVNSGTLAQLRVKARAHIEQLLTTIEDGAAAVAA